MLTSIAIHALFGVATFIYKLHDWIINLDPSTVHSLHGDEDQNSNWYNIVSSNPDITNVFTNMVSVLSFLAYLLVSMKDWEDEIIIPNILGFMIPMFSLLFLLPLRTFLQSPAIWTHVKAVYL